MLRRSVRRLLERGLDRFGYRIVNPSHKFGLDPIADIRRLSALWKLDMEIIFDVGANVGKTTAAYRSAWPRAAIYAFEPNETSAHLISGNLSPTDRVIVEPIALSDRSGRAAFYLHDAPDLDSLNERSPFAARFGVPSRSVEVEVDTLDDYCVRKSLDRISLLKIDTEGSDYEVLRGATSLLSARRIDFVYCEFNSFCDNGRLPGSLMPIARLLDRHGYNFIATYNDYITTEGAFFAVSNALFAADRGIDAGG